MLLDPPFSWRLDLAPVAGAGASEPASPDFRALPARPGVAVFESASGETVLIATGADVRELVRRRLEAAGPDAPRTRRVDLRAVTARVVACTVGSGFEAEAVCLMQARRRLPGGHRALVTRRQAWFVHVDPKAAFPRWSKLPIPGADEPGDGAAIPPGELLGPFGDKHAAQGYIELLDDLFDLCRHYNILVQAPRGAPCAYKEMGKCPAPCDGSESMDAYRARIALAVAFASGGAPAEREACEERMRRASAAMDFESAARERSRLELLEIAEKPALRHVDALARFRWLAVGRSEKPGWARLTLIMGGRLFSVADIDAAAGAVAGAGAWPAIESLLEADTHPGASDEEQMMIGLVTSMIFAPKVAASRRTEEFIPIARSRDSASDIEAVAAAAKRIARRPRSATGGAAADGMEDHDIAGPAQEPASADRSTLCPP